MADIKKNASKVCKKLKYMDIEQPEQSIETPSADVRIQSIQHAMLLIKFVDIMKDYNETQTDYRERCKDRIKWQLEIGKFCQLIG